MSAFVFKFDNIRGIAKLTTKMGMSFMPLKLALVFAPVICTAIPVLIAVLWAGALNSLGYGSVTILAVIFGVLFTTFWVMGFVQWFGTRWVEFNWAIGALFILVALCSWAFALSVALLPAAFSYTSTTATLFTVNFLPACYMVYQKTLWNDIALRGLLFEVSKRLEHKEKALDNAELDQILVENKKANNSTVRCRLGLAIIVYIIPLVIYGIVIYGAMDDGLKLLGVINPIFILAMDFVLLSLREHHSNKIENGNIFVYTSEYQALHMLFARVVLCFLPEYWLVTQSFVYFFTILVSGVDIS